MSQSPQQLFRQEALEHHARPEARGTLLQIAPGWARLTWWLLVTLVVVLGVGLALVYINDYASGPVLIQVKGLEEVPTTAGGRVSRVLVQRGDLVQAGQPLVELYSANEAAERNRVAQEFNAQLAARLLNPMDAAASQAVASLRAQLELSNARLAERSIKAPCSGRIGEVRARENQFLGAGEVVVTILREGAEVQALALVAGRYRPMLHTGQLFRMELEGFPYLYHDFTVSSVSDELVGPTEVRRYLGPGLGDVVAVQGPVVVVVSSLPTERFEFDGHSYSYYTGMVGTARVRVRARNGWLTLLPILELFEMRDNG